MENTYLCHYGRKGMKWGQHKFNPLEWMSNLVNGQQTDPHQTIINGRPESNLNTSGPHTGPFYNVHKLHVDENGNAAFDDGSVHLAISRRMNAARTVSDRILARNWDRPIRKVTTGLAFYADRTRNATPTERRHVLTRQGHGSRYSRPTVAVTRGATANIRNMSDYAKKRKNG